MFYNGPFDSACMNGPIDPVILKQANAYIKSMFLVTHNSIKPNSTLLVCAHRSYRQTRNGIKEVRELAAFAEIETFNDLPYISWLITVPNFQGRGLATRIIQQLQMHYSILGLHEDATNERLKNFYIKNGFSVVPGQDRIVPNDTPYGLLQHFMVWP